MAVITGAGLLNGTNDPDTITGSAGADTLNGLGGNDTLQGAAGADVLDGGEGSDTMIGGADNDTYVVDNTGDSIVENAAEGTDRVNTSVSYVLSGGASVEVFAATGSADVTLTGNEQSQTVIGNSGGNFIDGGSDQIAAGGAVTEVLDTLQGGLGNDTYVVRNTGDVVNESANAGVDTVLVAQFSAAAAAATASSYTLGAGESVEVFAALTAAGTEAINLTGNGLAQTIQGNAGANSLSGGGGSDTLTGLAGSDTYVVTNSGVTIVEADGAGSDVLQLDSAVGDYTLGAGVSIETVTVTGVGTINVTGNEFNQSITGNTAANLLSGGTGEDTLTGGDGSDTYVVNSSGDVVVETGTGTDRIVASQSFAISTTQLVEQLYAAGGSTTSSVSDQDGTLSINGLNTTSGDIFLVGSRGVSQTIVGNAGANILDGNRADTAGVVDGTPDTLAGLGGDDIYRVYASTDVVYEDRAGGFDRVFTSASYDLSANSGTFGGTTYYTTGQAEIELLSTANNSATTAGINLTGNGYGQIIVGNFGANSISGGYGTGGTSGTVNGGVEALIGLNGDDTYLVTSANTFVYEDAGTSAGAADVASVDATVVSSFTLNGGSHVETLQTLNAAGTEGIALVGNELAQNIIGNAGANTLSGGGVGVGDTLNGGAGNDTYRVFNGNDTIVDSAGTDSIFASGASYQLATGVAIEYISTAVQGAGDNIFLVGNDLQQSIIGNYGDNTLDGNRTAGGASETTTATNSDTLIGLFGSDIYRVYGNNNDGNGFNVGDLNADGDVLDAGESNISGDVVIEQAGNGNYDQVFASGNYQLRNGVEVEALSASNQSATSGNYILRGNSVAQLVVGNNAANTIDGRGGNDTLTGGGGNDVFAFTSALSASGNVDQITDFTAGDRIGLSTGIFTGVTYTSGVITQAEFTSNTTGVATDASQRIIFNSATGQLFYDADGSGSGASVLFAQVAVGTQLGFNDFISQGVVVDLPAVS